jgi:hypothetical protein
MRIGYRARAASEATVVAVAKATEPAAGISLLFVCLRSN